MKAKLILPTFILFFAFSSCKHEVAESIKNLIDTTGTNNNGNNGNGGGTANPCDPNTVYFQNDVLPIIISNCAYSGCHDAASAQDGVVLDSYENIMRTGEIVPGMAWESELFEKITETDPDDIMPPLPKTRLSQDQINKIAIWINSGAKNNFCESTAACDTLNVKFTSTIDPILSSYCKGCHSGASASAGIRLDSYDAVKIQVQNSKLLGAIKHQAGYSAMPKSGNKLDDCKIKQITLWIQNGAINN